MATEHPDPAGEADSLLGSVNRGQMQGLRLCNIGDLVKQIEAGADIDDIRDQLMESVEDLSAIVGDTRMAEHRKMAATYASRWLSIAVEAPEFPIETINRLALQATALEAQYPGFMREPEPEDAVPDEFDFVRPDIEAESVSAGRFRI